MTAIDIIKSTTKVITPIFGGKFMGKFAVKNARKDYKKMSNRLFHHPAMSFLSCGQYFIQRWVSLMY